MIKQATLDVYNNLADYTVGLAYCGVFTDDLTQNFILFSDDIIINQKNDLSKAKVVNFLLCESFQNVVRHGIDSNTGEFKGNSIGYFSLHNRDNDYRFNTINPIDKEDQEKVISVINNVNDKSKEELKALYRQRLAEGKFSDKGGAGLGYIQMARKTGKNILFDLDKNEDGVDQLHQQIMISDTDESKHTNRIFMSKEQLLYMQKANQILQYKGDFSAERLESISRLVEANLKSSNQNEQTRLKMSNCFNALFDNVKKHGAKVNSLDVGSLVVKEDENSFCIEMGNPIPKDQEESVLKKLEAANTQRQQGEAPTSIQSIVSGTNELEYRAHPMDDTHSFLTVNVRLMNI